MFRLLGLHFSQWLFLLTPIRVLFRLHLTPTEKPEEWIRRVTDGKDVVYVLPRMSILDLLAVNKSLKMMGMPRIWVEARPNRFRKAALLSMRTRNISFIPRSRKDYLSPAVTELLKSDHRVKRGQLTLLPVQVFWSRVPDRNERNILLRSLFPDEGMENVFQKYFMLLLHAGQLRVHFSNPVDLAAVPAGEEMLAGRRIRRSLLIEFHRERTAACGPVVYDLATASQRILSSQEVKRIVGQGENSKKQMRKALHYLKEIASKYNYNTIRAFETVLDFVWTRIFQGVRVRNLDSVAQATKAGQILWLPCHRSHLDYMLLSYLMKRKGLAAPHIAAGVNLSFFPAGPVLRRGGAFFLRRSFAGNKLYSAVFSSYVDFLLTNGHPIEFFHEGGRSRIGKLLPPKTGLTSMCVASIIKRRAENTFLCPVFISYDKVMEDNSYARELSGAKKEKESFWQLLKSLRFLFSTYGRVEVAFGTPIRFGDFWSESVRKLQILSESTGSTLDKEPLPAKLSDLRSDFDLRDSRIQAMVRDLARRVNQGINTCATASDTALLASVILSTPGTTTLTRGVCLQRVDLLRHMIGRLGALLGWSISAGESNGNGFVEEVEIISNAPQLTSASHEAKKRPDDLLTSAVRWGFLQPFKGTGADVPVLKADSAQLNLWWYRGTIFHLIAIPGVVAHLLMQACFSGERKQSSVSIVALEGQLEGVRQLWEEELFWPESTSTGALVSAAVELLQGMSLVNWDRSSGLVEVVETEGHLNGALAWIAALVEPEVELYSIQMGAALQLTQESGMFKRDELLAFALKLHRSAFFRGQVNVQSQLSHVFGGRISDAFTRARYYTNAEGAGLTVSFSQLSHLSSVLHVERWRDHSI
ncbi:MAG: glycerol-3-phosphate acyltransferase [Pseudomonadota bacterium]|jgi:glycerol-3-phosphate O-acyltransferase